MQATSSPKAIDLRPAILASLAAALFIAGLALGSALDLGIASTPAAAVAVPDTSYNAVEAGRSQFGAAADTSYDTVEKLRSQAGATSLFGKSGYPSSHGTRTPATVSSHDLARATGGWWASAPAPAEKLERDGAFGHGYR